eukprot:CAMPEP_0181327992 /NCGR_PEP_ID=MMETSP1101-20121128/22437_1 /TAXON_ID=46948 /ORGANISM="Rhodomonas abbreviata, Strain Caron Lab Isolate" /LENGTH=62 /DNA_ID=CAMNT_0023436769 /DNA_START=45 /DNA_END=233 /DNA_ORIENTATION=-
MEHQRRNPILYTGNYFEGALCTLKKSQAPASNGQTHHSHGAGKAGCIAPNAQLGSVLTFGSG